MSAIPITFVLDRLRSAHNTGNIFRVADAVGASEVLCCGYTPAPGHPKLAKTAMGAENMVSARVFEDAETAVLALRAEGVVRQIVVIEPADDAVCPWDFEWRFPVAVVLGNEALGVSDAVLAHCDAVVGLPMLGRKASFNVGNCAAVVAYGALKAFQKKENADD